MNVKVPSVSVRSLHFLFLISSLFALASCTVSKQISKQANNILLRDTAIRSGHIGISIYEPATGKYWYEHDADKYFVPASNTKLFTLYAGMKYLGDSLTGLRYSFAQDTIANIFATGDPTFLHPYFTSQPVLEFLKAQKEILISTAPYATTYGPGWAWDDHQESYMVPRSQFPMYGNLLNIQWIDKDSIRFYPKYLKTKTKITDKLTDGFYIFKDFGGNNFTLLNGDDKNITIPFDADILTVLNLLVDTLKNKNIFRTNGVHRHSNSKLRAIYSRKSDSLFKPMMHNSDNFFAEQTLLMVSNERLGYMNDDKMIDSLLRSDLKDVPQKPRWVDGSGLSRYNMFTPKSFVYILNKMKNEFGFERMKKILPTGGTGTLSSYYKTDAGFIFAKTGTLSNHTALSGYLITKNNKVLIFSLLVNHFQTGATPVRKAFEKFLKGIRDQY